MREEVGRLCCVTTALRPESPQSVTRNSTEAGRSGVYCVCSPALALAHERCRLSLRWLLWMAHLIQNDQLEAPKKRAARTTRLPPLARPVHVQPRARDCS